MLGCTGVDRRVIFIMAKSDVERDFPALVGKDYDLSDEDFNNNCLGFALGDLSGWWEPPSGHGQYWPPGFPEDIKVKTVEEIIKVHGFTVEISPGTPPETDAIAIYAIGDEWQHFARFSGGAARLRNPGGTPRRTETAAADAARGEFEQATIAASPAARFAPRRVEAPFCRLPINTCVTPISPFHNPESRTIFPFFCTGRQERGIMERT